jgi:predicted permease
MKLRAAMLRLAGMLPGARRARERELAAEIDSHLQMHIDDNLRAGMTPAQARREALLHFGGVEATKEACRDRSTIPFLEHLLQDVRFAIRQLRKNPVFTCTAVFVLALGMCSSAAIFAFVDAALIKPLPYRNPARLVAVFESVAMSPRSNLSYPDYLDWKKRNTVFSSLDVYHRGHFTLSTPVGAEPVRGDRVSDGFFRTLGVTPVLGRDFYAGEDLPSAPRTALLSYAAWQQRFGGRRDVLGRVVTLDGAPNIIIGVLPPDFHFGPAGPAEFWTAFHPTSDCDLGRYCHTIWGVARLKDGVSLQAASVEVSAIARQLEKQYPNSNRDQGATVALLTDVIVGDIRPVLLILLAGAGLLLLIATVNVTGLLLVRSESRQREVAMRRALGASSGRLIGQFVTEAVVLVAAGSALGLASAQLAMQLIERLISEDILAAPFLHGLGLNTRVTVFAGLTALVAAALFSLAPSLRIRSRDLREGLAEGSRGSSGMVWRRLGSRLVVLELATAMVLLTGAALLGKSLYQLLHVDIGLRPDRLVAMEVVAPKSGYGKDAEAIALAREMVRRIESLPGVESAGFTTNGAPISGNSNTMPFRVLGRPWHGENNLTPERDVSARYFATLGARLWRGRYFTDAEDTSKPPVAIVNRALVRKYFPGEEALGRQLARPWPSKPIEIVGIVEDIREGPLDIEIPPVLYIPFNQSPDRYFSLVVRTRHEEHALLPALAATIRRLDPGIVTDGGKSMTDKIDDSASVYILRSVAWLVGGFAALALLLGVVGLYGVIAYSVSQRTREIGVRMALGAEPGAVYGLILRDAAWLAAVGIGIGLVCSVAAARLIRGLLFGVQPWDVPTLAAVAALLAIAALLASYFPARRAASVDPVVALRAE